MVKLQGVWYAKCFIHNVLEGDTLLHLTNLLVSLRTFTFVAITGKMEVFPIIQKEYG